MAHRKEEYESNGHDVTIQQVRGPDSSAGATDPSAWIDGYAVSLESAIKLFVTQSENPDDLQEKVEYHRENGETWKAIKTLISWMTDCHVYYCSNCASFYDCNKVVGTGYAGHICSRCDRAKKHCPDNPDGDEHDDDCLNPRQKSNARVPTKYICKHCGRKRATTPTG